ncbi:MAG: DMT family transporter [Beijerinckiaceae bacterium]|nr:DMT family transporter [Beijerinckiaceae bacterium]
MPGRSTLLLTLAPGLFVLIWSTGWISARFAAPYADPLTFLSVRYALAGALLAVLCVASGAVWPRGKAAAHAALSGVLLHAIYLGGVWWAISKGLPAGISGLIAAVQPILTAFLAPRLAGETIPLRHWLGIVLGFGGILMVLGPKLAGLSGAALSSQLVPLGINVIAMISVTLGTFYQKRFIAAGDLRAVTVLQYAGALAITLPIAWLTEPMRIAWNLSMVLNMAWAVLALSIGAIGLLLMLIRQGAVSRAAALIYLVPPTVALEAFLLFGETLNGLQMVGMAVTAFGVALAVRR